MPYFARDQLYQQVWAQPLTAVAELYAISSARLRKVCRQLKIPAPQTGYWATKPTRRALSPKPMLPAYDGPPVFYEDPAQKLRRRVEAPPPPEPEELTRFRLAEERPGAKVKVLAILRAPLPIVAATKRYLLEGTHSPTDTRGFLHSAGGDRLALGVSAQNLDRALRLYDALLKALRSRGMSLDEKAPGDYRGTHVIVLGEKISIALKERGKRSEFRPTEQELKEATRRGYSYFPKWRYISTGELRFEIGTAFTTIHDDRSEKLESRLNDVLIALFAEALKRRERERSRQEDEKRRQVRAAEIARQKQTVEEERGRLAALEQESEDWHRATCLRAYLAALELAILNGTLEGTPEIHDKISWGYRKANWLDPLVSAEDPVLDMKISLF